MILNFLNDHQTGKNARLDQRMPEHSDHLSLLIDTKVKWSAKIGERWSDGPFFPQVYQKFLKALYLYIISPLLNQSQ